MKKIAISLCAAMLVFSLVSCGSKPEPEKKAEPVAPVVEEAEEPAPVVEETVEEPEAVEPEVIDNTETYNMLDTLRDEAINSGADKYAQEELASFDAYYNEMKARAENGEDISADVAELKKMYEALASYAKAKELQAKIEELGLDEYVPRDYAIAVAVMDEIDDSELSSDEFLAKAKEAYSKFNTAYIQGYKLLAKDAREDAFEAKRQADSVKAGVARKARYNEAVELFKRADAIYAMQNAEKATDYYFDAEDIFLELYETLYEQRAKVQAAIDAAKKKVEESERIAEQADLSNPISSTDADLVEDEDTVLLEEDDYSDDIEADIPEDIDDVYVEADAEDSEETLDEEEFADDDEDIDEETEEDSDEDTEENVDETETEEVL